MYWTDADEMFDTIHAVIIPAETAQELVDAVNAAEFDEGFGAEALTDAEAGELGACAVLGYEGESTALYVRYDEDGDPVGNDGSSTTHEGSRQIARWIVDALAGA